MKDLPKYITLNLLSIIGIVFFILSLFAIFYLYPDAKTYDIISGEDAPYGVYGFIIFCASFLFITVIIDIILIISAIIEFFIYRYKKIQPNFIKIKDKYSKIHLIFFISGLLLSIITFVLGLIYVFTPVVE